MKLSSVIRNSFKVTNTRELESAVGRRLWSIATKTHNVYPPDLHYEVIYFTCFCKILFSLNYY